MTDRVFTENDQRWFADVSGDRNPIHLDAIEARRLLAGRPVVHGVHLLLTALERHRPIEELLATTITSSFENPIGVGDEVIFEQGSGHDGRTVIDAAVRGVRCARITLGGNALAALSPGTEPVLKIDPDAAPVDMAPEAHLGRRYAVSPGDRALERCFPNLQAHLGAARLSSVAALSQFVGMVCPGRHSLLSSVTLDFRAAADAAPLTFSVRSYHPIFRLFDIDVDGPIRAQIRAFQRPAMQAQPALDEIAGAVRPDEFHGTRSLIVGGSRGLGELTAKILAAGGGDVIVTYRSGRDDAERVSGEINQARPGACTMLQLDVDGGFAAVAGEARSLDAACYFPTPRIFRKSTGVFSPDRFDEFSHIYVDRFFAFCTLLESSATKNLRVFFPSSVAVAERPKGLTEYAMAKAAAEVLIEDINRSFKKIRVIASRLPRLKTDQTATVVDAPAAPGIETLVPIVRSLFQ